MVTRWSALFEEWAAPWEGVPGDEFVLRIVSVTQAGDVACVVLEMHTPNDPSNPTQYTVKYRYEVEGIPAWATAPESMRAFPKIAADTAIQSASATLVKDTNGGWEVVPPHRAQ